MKYYIGTIFEQHGEFECDHTILFATPKCPDAYLELITQGWYDIDLDEDPNHEGVYWNDCMTYSAGKHSEIPKSVYDLLRTHTHLNSMGEENA